MKASNLLSQAIPSREGRKWIYACTKKHIPGLILLVLCCMIEACSGVTFAFAYKAMINGATERSSVLFARGVVFTLLIVALDITVNTLTVYLQEKLLLATECEMKKSVMHCVLNSDYPSISAHHSGELVQRVNNDTYNAASSLINICTSVVSMVVRLVSTVVALLAIVPTFTLCLFPACCILALIALLLERNVKSLQKDISKASGKVEGFMHEAVEKLLIVQGLDISAEVEKKTEGLIEKRMGLQKRFNMVQVKMTLGSNVFGYSGGVTAIIWCAYNVLMGSFGYGTMVQITTLVNQLSTPLKRLPSMIPQFITMTAATERILEIEEVRRQADILDEEPQQLFENAACIRAEKLVFGYKSEDREYKTVIGGADFTVPLSGMTVITGGSGGGKSTLLKLMLGVYGADSGELFFEMKDGRRIPIDRSTRSLFSYAPQGNLLLSGTIRDNIMIAKPSATEQELQTAVYTACMEQYISLLPQGLDTMLGENGSGLSEGQVQRINIARAILRGSPILLLDEVTSSLDIETEKTVLERICALKDRSCIAVTHRPAALDMAQWQVMVKDGQTTAIRR